MQLTKTIILKLDAPDNDLAELLGAFSQGMNYASQIVFDIGKPVGSGLIQKATYKHLRNNLNPEISDGLQCSSPGFGSLQNTSESDRQKGIGMAIPRFRSNLGYILVRTRFWLIRRHFEHNYISGAQEI